MTTMTSTAPGKLILTGEYAVLDGAPALVIAVDRRVTAQRRYGGPSGSSPFLIAVMQELGKRYPRTGISQIVAELAVDSSAFYDGEHKLGLGSSAAVTVAAVGLAVAELHNEPARQHRGEILEVALAAHAAAQGERGARGSGADIAAAVYGGAIEYVRGEATLATPPTSPAAASIAALGGDPTAPPPPARDATSTGTDSADGRALPSIQPLHWPASVTLLPFFTGHSADTATLVSRVAAARVARREAVDAAIAAIAAASQAVCDALRAGVGSEHVIAACKLAVLGVSRLAIASGVDLVPDCVSRAAAAVAPPGGTAKTTGAGGGDIGIAVIPATADVSACTRSLIECGCQPLRLSVDETGVDTRP